MIFERYLLLFEFVTPSKRIYNRLSEAAAKLHIGCPSLHVGPNGCQILNGVGGKSGL